MQNELAKSGDGVTCPIAVVVRSGQILTGLRDYTADKWENRSVWTLPGGRSDFGETIEQSLRREVAEEVGITDFSIVDFIGSTPGAKVGDTVLMFYCTTEQDATLMEPEKFSEWRWVTVNDYINESTYSGFNPLARQLIVDYLLQIKA